MTTLRRATPAAVRAIAPLAMLLAGILAPAAFGQAGWTGNVAINPGFEEDFVNTHAEGHVLSFKGDWYYNQKDLVPDYWAITGGYAWGQGGAHGGTGYLKLDAGAVASQKYDNAIYHDGGSSWAGAAPVPMKNVDPAKFLQPWRATVWVRNGGSITLGKTKVTAPAGDTWQQVTVDMPAADIAKPNDPVIVTLAGPGEFDDLIVQEKLTDSPNLVANAGFEKADKDGRPEGWSVQKKFRAIGPTYYVWTDWNHTWHENRGGVTIDPLVSFGGKQSLRFDVFPGDEKYVESDAIALNQATPGVIEVGVYVKADRIKLVDIRCVNEDGTNLPSVYPIQPENISGGSATYGNGTFGWRYIRKFFAAPFDKPSKSIRVRLAARGFNGHTLDDAGTRAYACPVGTVWWDNLLVTERGTDAATLTARGAKTQAGGEAAGSEIAEADLDLGQRYYGDNKLTLKFINRGAAGALQLRLTTTLPGEKPVVSEGPKVSINGPGTLEAPYRIEKLAGNLREQGTIRVELLRDGKAVTDTTYSFNTWPVIVDFDLARHFNLPSENPVTTSINLGVADGTLAKVAKLQLALAKASDGKTVVQALPAITDLKAAFAQTIAAIPKGVPDVREFNLPTPEVRADRTNLLIIKLDLSALKVWPHNEPTRDTVLVIRGLDASGKVLFEDKSEAFCRMEAPPPQPPIESVTVRPDGAVLINGLPRYLTGATHQNFAARVTHTPAIVKQLGLMGMRLENGMTLDEQANLYTEFGIYLIQGKPGSKQGSTDPVVELTPAQQDELKAFAAKGGAKGIVSFNTGGWEGHIPDDAASRAKHVATNDFVYETTKRPVAWSWSGAHTAWNMEDFAEYYDINHQETEMWGPMDLNVTYAPYAKKHKRPATWVYLPQVYDNTPYERYRFETYENIIRGSQGFEMIQGTGDATLNRGLAGELRGLEQPLNSLDKAPDVTFAPNISHKVTSFKGKTYILATNCGPYIVGNWVWNTDVKQSGKASHEGDTVNTLWRRPAGIRIHGMRGIPMPDLMQKGDKLVQYVWIDEKEKPEWVMLAVRGDGKFAHNAVLGGFNFDKFKADYGNIVMYSELEHSVWHEINWVFDEPTYQMSIKLMGQAWADNMKKSGDAYREVIAKKIFQANHFQNLGGLPAPGQWHKIEIDAEKAGLVGKLVDGFAYLTQNGRALWDNTALERDGKIVRVYCEDTVGIDRALLPSVRISVPGLKAGTKIKAMFEDRTITAEDGGFTDDFVGTDTYGDEGSGTESDLVGFVKDPNRELPRMMPSGTGYKYGPTSVHIYEIGN